MTRDQRDALGIIVAALLLAGAVLVLARRDDPPAPTPVPGRPVLTIVPSLSRRTG